MTSLLPQPACCTALRNQPLWKRLLHKMHVDLPLFGGVALLVLIGLVILYSASNQSIETVSHQIISFLLAFAVMIILAQVPPHKYRDFAPWFYLTVFIMLAIVLGLGAISKGAQRWLGVGLLRFQPSEMMKIAMPLMLAWYLKDKNLPPKGTTLIVLLIIIFVPVAMIAKQPDLGTALIIASTGILVLFLTGISWKLICSGLSLLAIGGPIMWHFMHAYQKNRILIFFDPTRDPRGGGYHIIQSKIAIGSGGFFGKGWLHGSQTHLQFLPEHATDFIFAVCGEELGFIGCAILIAIFTYLIGRGIYISNRAQDTFTRLLTGSLTLTFFLSFFINAGMVSGILPVVGLPLPLISYGGSSLITLMAGFGIIMSIHMHRKMLST